MRQVRLPELPGALYASAMPGRDEPVEDALRDVRARGVTRIVCLAPDEEIRATSPEYASALEQGDVPAPVERVPVRDMGVPDDLRGYVDAVTRTADALRDGERVMVHCRAGVGRTGTFAISVLMVLGLSLEEAEARVRDAGSGPESPLQRVLLREVAARLAR